MLGTLIAMHLLAGYKSEVRAIVKLRNIVQRLNASIQVESDNTFGLEWEKLKPQIKNRKSRNIMPATAQEIEYDLIEVLDLIVGEKRKIVIIFDELDKTDSAKRHEHSETLPEFEKLSVRPEQKVSSRTRKQEVLRIIANMKFFSLPPGLILFSLPAGKCTRLIRRTCPTGIFPSAASSAE